MRPITFINNDCFEGPRIGGTVPSGLERQIKDEHSQYFGTFPLLIDAEMEFSLFHRFDIFGTDAERDVIAHNNKVLKPCDLIWTVVHPRSRRGELSNQAFEARCLEIGRECVDTIRGEDGKETPYTESKLGGKCFFERHWLQEQVVELEQGGYDQLLQIGMHGSDLIYGFPWDPGWLHVWSSDPRDPQTYRFMVEQ